MTTPDQIQARIDAAKNEAISQVNDKFEALRVDMLKEVKPVKEKTIEEWAEEFSDYYFVGGGSENGLVDAFNEFFKNAKITPNE